MVNSLKGLSGLRAGHSQTLGGITPFRTYARLSFPCQRRGFLSRKFLALHIRTQRAIRRVDQAPHEPRAGVRHWRFHSRCARVRCVARGRFENKQLIFVAKVKNGFLPRIRDEIFPALKKLGVAHFPFTNLPEKKASRWGESLTAEKMKECAGSNRSWSARWHSSNGRRAGTCGIAPSPACAMIKSLRRWFAKLELIRIATPPAMSVPGLLASRGQ